MDTDRTEQLLPTEGHQIVETEAEVGVSSNAVGLNRRRFLIGGVAGAAIVGAGGAASALIRISGTNPTPRSVAPPGLDPMAHRNEGAVPPRSVVRYLALAGTDGWVTLPSADIVGDATGVAAIGPYFPDPLAEPAGVRTTYAFSFRNVTGLDRQEVAEMKGHTQMCAPLFYSTVGEELWVTLTNLGLQVRPDLVDGHTMHWHGFRNAIPFYDGVPESSVAVPIGHDFTYVYRPEDAGTYMYHCHFEDVEHVTMGMQGIVFVKPDPADRTGLTGSRQKAYGVRDGDTVGETAFDREFAILIGEVDARAHFNDAHVQTTDWTDFHSDFVTFNGRSYPDTLEPNGRRDDGGVLHAQISAGLDGSGLHLLSDAPVDSIADRLASQPLSSLVEAAPGERVLIRFVNLGFANRSIVFPGLSIDVLGRDARYVPSSAQRLATDTIQIGPGESRDVFLTAPAEPGDYAFYDRGLDEYRGSADGSDSWIGGGRSAVRVSAGLGPQLKPNGWAGEQEWHGEQPLRSVAHTPPVVTVQGVLQTSGPANRRGRYLRGTIALEEGTSIDLVQWASSSGTTPPAVGTASWTPVTYTLGSPITYDVKVGSTTSTVRNYWVRAVDRNGLATISARVSL